MKKWPDKGPLFFIIYCLKDHFLYYCFGILFLYFTYYCQAKIPFLAKDIAEVIRLDEEVGLFIKNLLFLSLGIVIFRTLSRLLFFYPARLIQKNLRLEVIEKVGKSNPHRYAHYNSGQMFQIIQNDFNQIRTFLGFGILQICNIFMAFIILIPKIISFNPLLLWAFSPMFVSIFIFTIIIIIFQKYHKKGLEYQGEVQNYIIESYNGKKTIKNYQTEKVFINLFNKYSDLEISAFYKNSLGVAISRPLINLGAGISLVYGSYIIFRERMDVSSLILFSGFIFLLKEPIMFISWVSVVSSRAYASFQRIKQLLNDLRIKSNFERNIDFLQNEKEYKTCFDDFVYKVPFWNDSLQIDIKMKKWTVLIGKTGHGKSRVMTYLAEMIMRRGYKCSYIYQDPYIYNDSLKNNIFLGKVINKEDIKKAKDLLDIFLLNHLTPSLDDTLELQLGEKGKRLSGGQAKRVCLIRSLLSQSPFLLWDDPFSSVDIIQERMIINKIKKIDAFQNKTFILISHRFSTVSLCDYVIYLEKKKGIIDCGVVNEKLFGGGRINEYFQKQFL